MFLPAKKKKINTYHNDYVHIIYTATIALEVAAENQYIEEEDISFSTPSPLPDIPFYFGRKDCPRSPQATEQNVFQFPLPNVGWDKTFAFFKENLKLNERETGF